MSSSRLSPRECFKLFKAWGFELGANSRSSHIKMVYPPTGMSVSMIDPRCSSTKRVCDSILREGAAAVGVSMRQFRVGPRRAA